MKFTSPPVAGTAGVAGVLRGHVVLLESCDIDGLDEAGVIDLVRSNERAVRVLHGVGVRAALRLEHLGGLSTEDVFSTVGKQSAGSARRLQRRAQLAGTMPRVVEGLIGGTIGMENVDVVARARHKLRHNPSWQAAFDARDAVYATKAARLPHRRFSQWMRREVTRISDDGSADARSEREKNSFRCWRHDGRVRGSFDLDALTGEKLQTAVNAEARSLAKQSADAGEESQHHGEFLDACALESLIDGGNARKGRPSINVIVDIETLRTGVWDGTVKHTGMGNDLPLPHVRRLMCDAWITHTCLDAGGRTLAVGRSHRTATDAQRAALAVMYPTCALCDVDFDRCEIHHIQFWENGGATDLSNLIPLCGVHHHRVHDDGWTLQLNHDRMLVWIRPDGTVFRRIELPSAAPARHRSRLRQRQRQREREHGTTE
jgi:hypothetical protein